ncbi:hypothetical protein ACOMHN_021762 [Nucella lapillus]
MSQVLEEPPQSMDSDGGDSPNDFSMLDDRALETFGEEGTPLSSTPPGQTTNPHRLTLAQLTAVGQPSDIPPEARLQLFQQEQGPTHHQSSETPAQTPPGQMEFIPLKNAPFKFEAQHEDRGEGEGGLAASSERGKVEAKRGKVKAKHGKVKGKRGKVGTKHGKAETKQGKVEAKHEQAETRHGPAETRHGLAETRNGQDSNLASIFSLDSVSQSMTSAATAIYGQEEKKYLLVDPTSDEGGGGESHTDPEKCHDHDTAAAPGTGSVGHDQTSSPKAVQKHGDSHVSIKFLRLKTAASGEQQKPSDPAEAKECQDLMSDRNQEHSTFDRPDASTPQSQLQSEKNTDLISCDNSESSPGPGQASSCDQTAGVGPVPPDIKGQEDVGPGEKANPRGDDSSGSMDPPSPYQEHTKEAVKPTEDDAAQPSFMGWTAVGSDTPVTTDAAVTIDAPLKIDAPVTIDTLVKIDASVALSSREGGRLENTRTGDEMGKDSRTEDDKTEEGREEEKEMAGIVSDDAEVEQFSTPSSSPPVHMSALSVPDAMPEHSVGNATSPDRQGEWGTPPMVRPASEDDLLAGATGAASSAQMGPATSQLREMSSQRVMSPQRMMSPQRTMSPQRMMSPQGMSSPQLLTHGQQSPSGDGSAFRPVPQRPAHPYDSLHNQGSPQWQSPQGYDSWQPACPSPQQTQQGYRAGQIPPASPDLGQRTLTPSPAPVQGHTSSHSPSPQDFQRYPSPSMPQWGPHPSLLQQQQRMPEPPYWQGGQYPTGDFSYQQHQQYQHFLRQQHQLWHQQQHLQQQQQQQQQQQEQQRMPPQDPGQQPGTPGGTTSATAPGGPQELSSSDSGYFSPQGPSVGVRGQAGSTPGQEEQRSGHHQPAPPPPQQAGGATGIVMVDTVRVSGVDESMDLEMMQYYFETPKKSGGDTVTNMADHRTQGYVLVTFEDPAVAERVLQLAHTLSRKQLTVTAEQPQPQEQTDGEKPTEDFSCTVQVSGGDVAFDVEMMDLYFENAKKSGGGKIEKIEVLEETGVTLVTFEEREVAEAVVKRTHIVSKTTLTVVPYQPPRAPTKVKVSGLPPKVLQELLQYYFEKMGGCDVEDVQLDEAKGEAVVTFSSSEAVQTVLSQDHCVKNKPVKVTALTSTSSPTSSVKDTQGSRLVEVTPAVCTVEVRGLASNTLGDTVHYYFENKRRSGGGPVKNVQYHPGTGVAQVTFEDAEVVPKVLAKKHKIDDQDLEVKLYTPHPTPDVDHASESAESAESQELTVVSVHGLSMSTSTDNILNYFENKRRSGGGEVTEIRRDAKKGMFYVTFQNATDAANVAGRQHTIQKQEVDVQLHLPLEMCKDRVILSNLPEIRSSDELLNFVELKTDKAVDSILFATEEEGVAVIIFKSDIDVGHVRGCLMKKPFKKKVVEVEAIPVSCTLLVTDLPSHIPVTQDMLSNYFDNLRRSGGENVAKVEVHSEELYALVTFEDSKVAARVAGRQHQFQRCPVTVGIHMECLGLSGGSPEPTVETPPPLPLSEDQFQKILSLKVLVERYRNLEDSLEKLYARLEFSGTGSVCVKCLLTPDVEGVRQLVKTWAEDVQQCVDGHLGDVFAEKLAVSEEEQVDTEPSLKEMTAGRSDVGFHFDAERRQLQVVCKGDAQRNVMTKLITAVKETQEKLNQKKRETTEQMKIGRVKVMMLQKQQEFQCLLDNYRDSSIICQPDLEQVALTGPVEEIRDIQGKIFSIVSSIISARRQWDSKLHSELILQNEAARARVESLCCEEGPEEIVEFTQQGITVHSFDAQRVETVQMAAVRAVAKRVIPFNTDNRSARELEGWTDLKQSVLKGSEGLMILDEDTSGLTLVSVSPSLPKDVSTLKTFLQENSVQQGTFPLPLVLHKIFQPFLRGKVIEMQLTMDSFDFDTDNSQIVVNGNKEVIDIARNIYTGFRQRLVQRIKEYKQPSMNVFFDNTEWKRKEETILQTHRCLILDLEETRGTFLEEQLGAGLFSPGEEKTPGFRLSPQSFRPEEPWAPVATGAVPKHRLSGRGRPQTESAAAAGAASGTAKPDIPVRPRLYLSVMSDITKEEHHVLVNSSNTSLTMTNGQVSKALLEVGGQPIQDELKANYPEGLTLGSIAVSTGGKLNCKKLIHCCLPEQKDEKKIAEVVRDAVTKCLTETERLGMGSVGFPSLGTGNLGYPAPMVARVMFESALDYGRENPDTVISDVFFILHKNDEKLTQVFREEHESYKQLAKASAGLRHQEEQEEDIYAPEVNPSSQGLERHPFFEDTRGLVRKLVVGTDEGAVREVEKEVLTMYKETVSSKTFDVPRLESWEDLHKNTIIMACKASKVDVTLNFGLSRIELRGFLDNLGRIPIHRTLKDAEADVNAKQNAKLLQQQVQWSVIEIAADGEHLEPYEMFNNYRIETAYQDGEDKVIVVDNGKGFIVNFARMEEIPELSNTQDEDNVCMSIIRQDKIHTLDVNPPPNWSAMKEDLDVVAVPSSSDEYTGVAEIFLKSLNYPSAKIVKIERVQNLTLYKQYQAMKRQMESTMSTKDKHCERSRLWHGTKEEAVQGIIKYGFNRSYSDIKDLRKSAYGQGAYFATTAEYSSRNEYSVASPGTQERNMFMCKVLVGEYRLGSSDMRTPPEITPGKRCHTTVNDEQSPEIFVTYSDVQAYPEYRITFKDK